VWWRALDHCTGPYPTSWQISFDDHFCGLTASRTVWRLEYYGVFQGLTIFMTRLTLVRASSLDKAT
jgi:hypothetical protein